MTLQEKHYWQVAVESLRVHIAELQVIAVRQGLVMPQAWCESLEREALTFGCRISRQITQEKISGPVREVSTVAARLGASRLPDSSISPANNGQGVTKERNAI
jgi:hypothetical protein